MKSILYKFKYIIVFGFLIIGLTSCDFIITKKSDKTKIEKTTEPIDFSSVDAYPLLKECEEMSSRKLQKECFYKLLSKQIEVSLSNKNISFSKSLIDTIQVRINVSSKGIISVKSLNISNNLDYTELRNAIIQSIDSLPQIQPAIKRGIPVTTEFVLPIVLSSNS